MIVNGQKWACQSCIRGHRVSNCTHSDRELFPIAPKGRPVKQCEHCRSARNSKSHHAKCDCGSKKHNKDSPVESEPKLESHGCCCHIGSKCICGTKGETTDRHKAQLSRPTLTLKGKPSLVSSSSEPNFTKFTNGHHKPVNGEKYHESRRAGKPYTIPNRPVSLHDPSSFAFNPSKALEHDTQPRALDDMLLFNTASPSRGNGVNYNAQLSADNLNGSSADFNPALGPFDFRALLEVDSSKSDDQLSRTTSGEALSTYSTSWFDSGPLTTVAEAPGDFATSPSGLFPDCCTDTDWNIPSATTDFFSPADLPLVTSQPSDFSQAISHSGESNYQSAPALTASSSGAQSEVGEPTDSARQDQFPNFWSGTVQFRDSYRHSSGSMTNDFSFPQSLPSFDTSVKQKPARIRHRQTYSSGSSTHHHSHNLSDSTTVPDDHSTETGVNIGHLQNLATLKSAREAAAAASQAASNYSQITESGLRSITIPADQNDGPIADDWYFPIEAPRPSEQTREFSWLLDSA